MIPYARPCHPLGALVRVLRKSDCLWLLLRNVCQSLLRLFSGPADIFQTFPLLRSLSTAFTLFTRHLITLWSVRVFLCRICHSLHFILGISDSKFLNQNHTIICQQTVLCDLLRCGVAFVSTHLLRLDVSRFLHLSVLTIVRPLSNKQITCKLIFCADASFSFNLILWIDIWVATFSCVLRQSVSTFPLSDVPFGFYNSSSSSRYLRRN